MREFFIGLCAFAVIGGILRSFVSEENFARMFSLISGILILIVMVSSVPELRNEISLNTENKLITKAQDFDGVVISQAEERLSGEVQAQMHALFGVKGDVSVSLSYEDGCIEVLCVHAEIEDEAREGVRRWLCEYFNIEEGAVNFN